MIDVGSFATISDVLRLVAVPAFVWAAYWDVKTRRVANRLWPPLLGIALITLLFEGWSAFTDGGILWREFLMVTTISVLLLIPLAYGFWYLGGFGGADAKAIMVLALLFPTVPTYALGSMELPMVEPAAMVFSLSILTNAVIIGLLYPAILGIRNLLNGDIGWIMLIGRKIDAEQAVKLPGRLLETPHGLDRHGLDLDALRMYLRWRQCTLTELRSNPDQYRGSSPNSTGEPGDGAIADGGIDDPWAAEMFLDELEGTAYGTTPNALRNGLEALVRHDHVWYTPGIPFILLIAAGLLVALTFGDLFTLLMSSIGLI